RLALYDRFAREPVAAVLAGFVLMTAMIGLINKGVGEMGPGREAIDEYAYASVMPRKLDRAFREAGLNDQWEIVGVEGDAVRVRGTQGLSAPEDLQHLVVAREGADALLALPETFLVQ